MEDRRNGSKYVLIREFEREVKRIKELESKMETLTKRQEVLWFKASIWGMIGAALAVLIGLGIYIIKGGSL